MNRKLESLLLAFPLLALLATLSPNQIELALSLCFGLFHEAHQIGLARVVTDRATYAWLCDVYVLEEYRGQGLAVWLMECVCARPDLQGLRRFSLATRDAHELYRKFGFEDLDDPSKHMEIFRPRIYGL